MGRHKKLNDMARDDWRQVVGMPDGYEVNSAGHFRSKLRMPRESKPRTVLISNGHVGFRLPGRKRTSISAARAVWQTFRGPIPPGMVVVKKNDMIDDNALENLMLSTPESYSAKVSSSKNRRTVVQIENGREVRVFPSVHEAAAACYVDKATVWRHCVGQSKRPLGENQLTFRFDDYD